MAPVAAAPAAPPALPSGLPPALPPGLPPAPAGAPAPERDVGSIVANAALTRLGAPYAWAAAGPDAFDCSGLVVWSFRQAGLALPRSSQALASGGQPVPLDQMRPGDVISLFPDASHVGIYVGGGRMVHAQFEGQPVIVESLYRAPIHNVRRYR
jgi:cell wall-associated NlpC family hydrolase